MDAIISKVELFCATANAVDEASMLVTADELLVELVSNADKFRTHGQRTHREYLMGRLKFLKPNVVPAEIHFLKVVKMRPSMKDAYRFLIECSKRRNDLTTCIHYLKMALDDAFPRSPDLDDAGNKERKSLLCELSSVEEEMSKRMQYMIKDSIGHAREL